jgi:thioredoxin reductase
MRDLIIIGGGAAGLAAAAYAQEKRLDFLLVALASGKATAADDGVGKALTQLFSDRLADAPEALLADRVRALHRAPIGFMAHTEKHGPLAALAVLVATGVQPVALPAAGAAVRHDQSYSAATHAQRMAGKHVAVIGATPRSLRGAHELSAVARRVSLVVEHADALSTPLAASVQYRANVDLLDGYHVGGVEQMGAGAVLQLTRGAITRVLAVDAVFVDLGLRPDSVLVRPLLQTDDAGFIPIDADGATAQPGLFAAGDVTTAFAEQALVAVGQGARAAQSAYEYVLARHSLRQPHTH